MMGTVPGDIYIEVSVFQSNENSKFILGPGEDDKATNKAAAIYVKTCSRSQRIISYLTWLNSRPTRSVSPAYIVQGRIVEIEWQ